MRSKTIIAGLIICLLLLALPAIASEYTLDIFGNANEDNTINMQDVTFTELIILEYKEETELSDAKYDRVIDILDVTQIELIILGREKEMTLIDTANRVVTVKKPVDRIIIINRNVLETMRSLKATDKIVGVTRAVTTDNIFFPEFNDFPGIGSGKSPDIEKVLELQPDVVFYYGTQWTTKLEEIQNILDDTDPGIAVVAFDCFKPAWYIEETMKLGYILDKKQEAEDFIEFYQGCKMPIMEIVEGISEEDKPKVCILRDFYTTYGVGSVEHQMVVAAGGHNIFNDFSGTGAVVDAEEIIKRDPEFIIWIHRWAGGYLLNVEDTAELKEIYEGIMDRPEMQNVPAVESGNVHVVTNDVYRGARDFVGIGYLAQWFHPELFRDIDPQANHQEYLRVFQDLDYDLDEQGVFVYPITE